MNHVNEKLQKLFPVWLRIDETHFNLTKIYTW